MEKELKELLLKDLTARLLYEVKGIITYNKSNTTFTVEGIDNNVLHLSDAEECYVEDFKPYLRPMSSMTEEENKEYNSIWTGSVRGDMIAKIDFYIKHHFDFRLTSEGSSMIESGLALEAPIGMYNLKN